MNLIKRLPALIDLRRNFFKSSRHYQAVIDLINDAVCFNQGELVQYSLLAGVKHKNIEDALHSKSPDKNKVGVCKEELENHLNSEFDRVVKENFKRIRKYFDGRAKQEPRVCIKVERDDVVIDLFREEDQLYAKEYNTEDNKAFLYIDETGKCYLCNDIPNEAKLRRYYNPRLNEHKALLYKPSKLNWFYQELGKEDRKWIECWEPNKINGRPEAPLAKQCYKSTLITPITLKGNTLAMEFMRQFKVKSHPEEALYGFLCFDHHHTNYFKPEVDKPVSYIFAHLLSLYLIINLAYTEYSGTYHKAEQFLCQRKGCILQQSTESTTPENYIVSAGNSLIDYARTQAEKKIKRNQREFTRSRKSDS